MPQNTIGLLSLMFWPLIIVVTIKYLTTVMRADNDGEGGILALAALVSGRGRPGMAMWREHLYAFMSRNATGTIELFKLPIEQTLQIGVGVEL